MAAGRSLASLTLSFGLVNVPVNLFAATDSASGVSFNLLAPDGSRVKQQYLSEKTGKLVERSEMIKGYEFEDDHFVTFTKDELEALDEASSHVIEVVAFVPEKSVDPIYFDKAYFLAPDKRGGKPYALLAQAMPKNAQCALARYVMRGKQYVAQVRAVEDGLVLQHLLYADEVRSLTELKIPQVEAAAGELELALQLIDHIAADHYDPSQFQDEEKARILQAIDRKIAGKKVVESPRAGDAAVGGGHVIDLVEALEASLQGPIKKGATKAKSAAVIPAEALKERKSARRVPKVDETAAGASSQEPVSSCSISESPRMPADRCRSSAAAAHPARRRQTGSKKATPWRLATPQKSAARAAVTWRARPLARVRRGVSSRANPGLCGSEQSGPGSAQ